MPVPYCEGDWFAVPLESGGYAAGLIARSKPGSPVLLGYFFGPRLAHVPAIDTVSRLRANDAIFVRRFGDLGFLSESRGGDSWPIIGRVEPWDRCDWAMPVFGRVEPLRNHAYSVTYPDDDPNGRPREARIPEAEVATLPDDGMSGHVILAKHLDSLISEREQQSAD